MKKLLSLATIMTVMLSCEKNKETAQTYAVNNTSSVAEWEGHASDHSNSGSFEVKGSFTTNAKGQIKEGSFVMPIASIKNFNLPDEVKPQLLEHLKSADFFNMALHPNTEFKITKVEPYNKAEAGSIAGANYLVTGKFTMIGQTHAISFPAKITQTADSIKTEAKFKLDRTKWGMNSYSNPDEGMYIQPNVDMHLKVAAGKQTK